MSGTSSNPFFHQHQSSLLYIKSQQNLDSDLNKSENINCISDRKDETKPFCINQKSLLSHEPWASSQYLKLDSQQSPKILGSVGSKNCFHSHSFINSSERANGLQMYQSNTNTINKHSKVIPYYINPTKKHE